ncbi:glycosyltransferase [Acinetobacter bereziniae]|uniref:Glycosyltransferase n=2 Tax=Acinetobacter bereziniae TaxID=106648 RepID=A0A8I1DJS0_ACIBZ|nr:glycosyltransferase [Acinetobacter bereziniae]MEC8123177.1 glycosyltransferase [Pseudomonadota bacterium]ENV90488.1 hypothetical protein F938_04090 [Acinetobacter bereziniae LMG 1003 = CIP 70.12]MDG3557263.1 glycosyltransferase [Acinetobacter bereziniae]MDP6000774.1 glycosyltransferase [Acinetobacter bereziniae]QQC80638.1 glycosyl transferase family 1 [Acinetobacter bereziniae]
MILFLSKFPQTESEYRDGFFQRVASIDQFYQKDERIYLDISLFHNWKKKASKNGLRIDVSCNILLHFFYILNCFNKSSFVYIQSIYNAIYSIFFILIFNKFFVLDLHGVVPEELMMKNKKIHTLVAGFIERVLFKKINVCIAVTNKMVTHYKKKYPSSSCQFIVYAIIPSHLKRKEINDNDYLSDKIEIIYSGNTQIWQNIDLMLEAIKKNLDDKFRFTILTGEPNQILKKLKEFQIDHNQLLVKSVKPNELEDYYRKSHYGFVLRNDILVNQVACPTKIIEYLTYGIIPIVLSEKIGDFEDYGYEYIMLDELNNQLPLRKSMKNLAVIQEIFDKNDYDLKAEIYKFF